MEWNWLPHKFKNLNEKEAWQEIKLEERINLLKRELADLAKIDSKVTIEQALEKIVNDQKYTDTKQLYMLYAACERLKLENIKDYKVIKYLPHKYFLDKDRKPKIYIPEKLYDP